MPLLQTPYLVVVAPNFVEDIILNSNDPSSDKSAQFSSCMQLLSTRLLVNKTKSTKKRIV